MFYQTTFWEHLDNILKCTIIFEFGLSISKLKYLFLNEPQNAHGPNTFRPILRWKLICKWPIQTDPKIVGYLAIYIYIKSLELIVHKLTLTIIFEKKNHNQNGKHSP